MCIHMSIAMRTTHITKQLDWCKILKYSKRINMCKLHCNFLLFFSFKSVFSVTPYFLPSNLYISHSQIRFSSPSGVAYFYFLINFILFYFISFVSFHFVPYSAFAMLLLLAEVAELKLFFFFFELVIVIQ